MAKDTKNKSKYIPLKASDGSVTVTRRNGPYDRGKDPKYSKKDNETLRGIGGYSKAKVIKEIGDPDSTAKVMRKSAAESRAKYAKKK